MERNVKVRDLASHLRDPVMKAYFMFLSVALKPLAEYNIAFQVGVMTSWDNNRLIVTYCMIIQYVLFQFFYCGYLYCLQSEGVQIHRLEEEMCRLIRRFLGYLIPARAILDVPLREVNYGEGHQLEDEDLFIGAETKAFIRNAELLVSSKNKNISVSILLCTLI